MNLRALQDRLRQFAADRDWQPYQTPKNLAMAMTVEAAELLEIFQWLTPEESLAIADDAERHQHLGEELADVMLYLLQIADHSGVDLETAVERKLALNAVKHPPKR
jgi:NTP pyrophosphatase (non-canonical NTP hydrolase)